MLQTGQHRCLIKIKDSKAILSFVCQMSHPLSAVYEEPREMFGGEGVGERVLIPADPLADARAWLAAMKASRRQTAQQTAQQPAESLADARAWLAAMEISRRRNGRQAAQHSGSVIKLRSVPPNDGLPGNQFLADRRRAYGLEVRSCQGPGPLALLETELFDAKTTANGK